MDKNPLVLLELVERLANLMRAELRKAGTEERLQLVHLQALVYLVKANRYSNTPQALAAYLGLTKGTVSQTLLILDRRGLIERYQDDVDRRVVRLRLSTAGESCSTRRSRRLPGRTPRATSAPTGSATRPRRCARRSRPCRRTTRERCSGPAPPAPTARSSRSGSSAAA